MLKIETEEYLKWIGAQIEKERKRQGISKVQLAFEIETSESNIRRIEKGKVNVGGITLLKIAKALNVRMSVLVDFDELE